MAARGISKTDDLSFGSKCHSHNHVSSVGRFHINDVTSVARDEKATGFRLLLWHRHHCRRRFLLAFEVIEARLKVLPKWRHNIQQTNDFFCNCLSEKRTINDDSIAAKLT